jgi:hypothetical protein
LRPDYLLSKALTNLLAQMPAARRAQKAKTMFSGRPN